MTDKNPLPPIDAQVRAIQPKPEPDEDHACRHCVGTGEGLNEHSNCWHCRGSGITPAKFRRNYRNEE